MKKSLVLALALSTVSMFSLPVFAGEDHKACESKCGECAEMCQKNLDYCKKKGGAHAKAEHINLMKDCIAMCKTNSELRSRKSKYAADSSKLCAKICNDCAASCESLKDPKLKECVEMCKACAECCTD